MNCDLIVIGAGPGGYEVASRQAAEGKSVVIIEKDHVGGTCLNRGCIPTKCLCAGADAIGSAAHFGAFGVTTVVTAVDFAQAQSHARDVVAQLRQGVEGALAKCTVVRGSAAFNADGTVSVDGETFSAPKVIIATGSAPNRLNIPGAELAMTSDDFLKLDSLPKQLVIIGGGVIGIEFAYLAQRYGSQVTVVEYCKEILPGFDSELAKRLRTKLAADNISFVTSAAVSSIGRDGDVFTVTYTDKKGAMCQAAGDGVLMAVGRRAVVPEGWADAGIVVDGRGFIVTDADMTTTRPGVYAVGDCNGRLMLAHVATAQAMHAAGYPVNLDVVPAVVFAQPEFAMVGLTADVCKERGIAYKAGKALYRANGKALASDCADGIAKVLVDPESQRILGAHILGAHASDLISDLALAMSAGLPATAIGSTIHSHPSLSEVVHAAIAAVRN